MLLLPIAIVLFRSLHVIAGGHQPNTEQNAYKDNGNIYTQPQQAYAPQGNSAHSDYGLGTRQGALLGNPLLSILPVVFIVGLGALILVPLLFLLFNPIGGGFGGGYGSPQGPFGKKRSVSEDFMRKNLLDIVSTVSDAIEKYGGNLLEPKKP